MAITILGTPHTPHPVYNPSVYYLDSTLKNLTGFKYIVEIYDAGTTDKILEMDVQPEPYNQYGSVDLSKILSNKINSGVDLTSSVVTNVSNNNLYKYDIKFGEQVPVFEQFSAVTGNNVYGNGIYYTNYIIASSAFTQGTQVRITLDNVYGTYMDDMNGLFTVISSLPLSGFPGYYNVAVNQLYNSYITATDGKMSYADNRKTRTYNLTGLTDIIAVNMAENNNRFKEHLTNIYSTGLIDFNVISGSTAAKFMTSMPRTTYTMTTYQDLWLNWCDSYNATYVYFKNSNGETWRTNASIITSEPTVIKQIPVGPNNYGTLIPVIYTGLGNLVKDDTTWYDIYLVKGSQLTEKIRINLDRRCSINEISILFADRQGTFNSFAFQLNKTKNMNYKNKTYTREIGGFDGTNGFNFNLSDSNVSVYHSEFDETYEINTNWMNSDMATYYEELLTSPEKYIKWTDGNYYSVNISDGSDVTTPKKLIRKKLIINFSLKNPINI